MHLDAHTRTYNLHLKKSIKKLFKKRNKKLKAVHYSFYCGIVHTNTLHSLQTHNYSFSWPIAIICNVQYQQVGPVILLCFLLLKMSITLWNCL